MQQKLECEAGSSLSVEALATFANTLLQKSVLVSSEDLGGGGIYHLLRLWQKVQLQKGGESLLNSPMNGFWIKPCWISVALV